MKKDIKNLLMGSVSKCKIDDVYIWMNSFIQNCNRDTDGMCVVVIKDEDTYNNLLNLSIDNNWVDNVEILHIDTDVNGDKLGDNFNCNTGVMVDGNKYLIHHYRFYINWLLLKYKYHNIETVIFTDVRDVVFDNNPFNWIENEGVTVAGENILMKDEDWNKHTMINMFGQRAYNTVKSNEALCCGVMGGSRKEMMQLSKIIYFMSCGFQVSDQMSLNILYEDSGDGYITSSHKVYQVHTNWICSKDKLLDKTLHKQTGEGYSIIHQYDRVQELNALYSNKYGFKNK